MPNTKKIKSKKKRKSKLLTLRQATVKSYETFYDIDRKIIKVSFDDFIIYVDGVKKKLFTPLAWDSSLARKHTGLTPDQLMFIKTNFIKLSREYNFDMGRQEFR